MTSTNSKYKAKHVFWNYVGCCVVGHESINLYRQNGKLNLPHYIWRFDSVHEFKVYQKLCRIVGAHRIIRQYELEIFPPSCCYPKGKTWRVDFAIIDFEWHANFICYIEAKGAFMPEFATVLACLEQNNKAAFDKVSIVFPNKLPKTNRVLNSLKKQWYKKRLMTLRQLAEAQSIA